MDAKPTTNWLPIHSQMLQFQGQVTELCLFGGAGGSKTWFHLRTCVARALLWSGSVHLCLRHRFEHAKTTLWMSAQALIKAEWPGLYDRVDEFKSGGTWKMTFPNGSALWFGGLDDKERVEKHLGSEYTTVYFNEVSEIKEEANVDLVRGRLRLACPGRHLALLDMNPPTNKHWTYNRYGCIREPEAGRIWRGSRSMIDPDTGEDLTEHYGAFKVNPGDVRENLPPSYIAMLNNYPPKLRKRFWDGEFTTDVEGALWSFEMIDNNRENPDALPDFVRVVVAVDPGGSGANSDPTGIAVLGKDAKGRAWMLQDETGKHTPEQWASKVSMLYHKWRADKIVAEKNHGGEMVESTMRMFDASLKNSIALVSASRGKIMRAEPIALASAKGDVRFAGRFPELEDQMLTYTGEQGQVSPNNLDAFVWGATELLSNTQQKSTLTFC